MRARLDVEYEEGQPDGRAEAAEQRGDSPPRPLLATRHLPALAHGRDLVRDRVRVRVRVIG